MAAIGVCACASIASAQTASEPALKAAFLLNFAKFTEWPAEALAPGDAIVLCVINDGAVGEMLVDLTKGRTVDGHALTVSVMKPDSAALASCRLLFTAGLDAAKSSALLESIAGKPVFTVGDSEMFAQMGGVANFFVDERTMRFAINLDAAHRAGIHLSSKLLSLAKIVKEDRRLPRR